MNTNPQLNLVALSLPAMRGFLVEYYGDLIGQRQAGVLLLVAIGDQVQYVSNCEQPQAARMLQDLLARWHLGLPDTMPGESTPGDTRAFEYLLNTMELAGQAACPADAGYGAARKAVIAYVGDLVGKMNRTRTA